MSEAVYESLINALVTHGRATGKCEAVRVGEFKSPPPKGLSLAFWFAKLGSAITGSGLAVTAARVRVTARLYFPALTKPDGVCEVRVAAGASALLGRLNGDLTLGGLLKSVDILGEGGDVADWTFGYLTLDSTMYRVADLEIDAMINDQWVQSV